MYFEIGYCVCINSYCFNFVSLSVVGIKYASNEVIKVWAEYENLCVNIIVIVGRNWGHVVLDCCALTLEVYCGR